MRLKLKFLVLKFHALIVGFILVLISIFAAYLYWTGSQAWKPLIPVFGAAFSLIFIIEKHQLDEAHLFKELFIEFNSRYNELNDDLNKLTQTPINGLDSEQLKIVNDYFNLCAEEYLFYTKGYIYPEVWKSWIRGMKIFFDIPDIQQRWDKELISGSYYGFDVRAEIKSIKGQT